MDQRSSPQFHALLSGAGLLLAALAASGRAADCPSPEKIAPCRCDPEGVSCVGADITYNQVRNSFYQLSVAWPDYKDKYVRGIWIQGSKMTDAWGELIWDIRSEEVYVQMNDIHNVQNLDFLSRFRGVLRILNLYGNKINSMNYGQLKTYTFLEEVNLGKNKLTTVDNWAFSTLLQLRIIILSDNEITTLNRYAFEYNTALERLDLSRNQIATLGPNSLLCNSQKPNLWVSIADNPINSVHKFAFEVDESIQKQALEPKIFNMTRNRMTSFPSESFIHIVARMAQIRGTFDVTGNQLSCKGADYCWIVHNKGSAAEIFTGFKCTDGKGIKDLTLSNVGC